MKKLSKWIRHNQGVAVSLVAIASMALWTYGCESQVVSLMDPTLKVNRAELELEVKTVTARLESQLTILIQQAELKFEELKRKDEIKQMLVNFAAITADAQTVNPAGVVGLAFSILGIGAVVDNRLKDKVIKNRPLKVE